MYIQICTFCFSHCHNFDNDCKAFFFFFFLDIQNYLDFATFFAISCGSFTNSVVTNFLFLFWMFHLLPRVQVLHLPIMQKPLHLLFIRECFKYIYLFFLSACLQQFSTCLESGRVRPPRPPSPELIYQNSTDGFYRNNKLETVKEESILDKERNKKRSARKKSFMVPLKVHFKRKTQLDILTEF